jgi:hypothetical protein
MEKTKLLTVVAICLAVMLGGCDKKVQATAKTGFLSTYKNLEPAPDNRMQYISQQVGGYWKFVIDPITVKLYDEKTGRQISPADVLHLEQYFYSEVLKQMPDRYQTVPESGPAVARLRIAITNLEKSNPSLNVLPQTKLTGMGLGPVSAEMELVDSMTGEQLAAAIDSNTGGKFSLSGLSAWDDVEAAMKDWARRMWVRVDEAHGFAK